jgi:microsomal epoxide hydrolase
MKALGYDRYVAQGGDWGGILVRRLAQLFPDRVTSIHINHVMLHPSTAHVSDDALSEVDRLGAERRRAFVARGSAYAEMQGTVIYSIGGALAMSPLATIAYIAEKWYRWSAPDSQPSLDDVLTHTLLYWLTGRVTSSFWLVRAQLLVPAVTLSVLVKYYNRKFEGDGDALEALTTPVKQATAVGMGHREIYWFVCSLPTTAVAHGRGAGLRAPRPSPCSRT